MGSEDQGERLQGVGRPTWDARAARAERLAEEHPESEHVLRFYGAVVQMQRRLYEAFEAEGPDLVQHFPLVLSLVEIAGNEELRQHAHLLRDEWPDRWREMMDGYRAGSPLEAWEALFARVFLEPYMEWTVDHGKTQTADAGEARCPQCGGAPQALVLRGSHQSAQRRLACSLCHREWPLRRPRCPRCGKGPFHEVPAYTGAKFDYIRMEACDSCKGYLLAVDARKCPEAIPVVDELAAVPVNLWAAERGYEKIQRNLLGL